MTSETHLDSKHDRPPGNLISVTLNKRRVPLLLDSGACVSCMSHDFALKIGAEIKPVSQHVPDNLFSADGVPLKVIGQTEATVNLKGLLVPHVFVVIKDLNHKALAGMGFLQQTGCKLDMKANMASFFDDLVILPLFRNTTECAVLRTVTRLVVPALTEIITRVSVPSHFKPACGLLEPHAVVCQQPYVVAKALVTVHQPPQSRQRYTFCRVLNLSTKPHVIRRGTALATIGEADSMCPLQKSSVCNVEGKPQISTEDKLKKISDLGLQISHEHMDDKTYERLCDLLYQYSDIFATKLSDLTGSNIIQCHIETKGQPFRIRPYRLSPPMRKELDQQLDEMMKAGIITESDNSPFASPVVMVKKANGEYRFCVDYRRLNRQTTTLYHELPCVQDVVDLVSQTQSTVYSVLDLRAAYFQLPLTEQSMVKTTFVTPHRGSLKFARVPMGWTNSGYYCTQALNKLFRHQIGTFMLIYVDDVIIASPNQNIHLQHLETVFSKFRDANLKLHPAKCQLMLPELSYLGFKFSSGQVTTDPRKTAIVKNYPQPTCTKDVRSFVGLTNYLRKCIPNYADKAHGLVKLLRKNVSFSWGPEQQQSFTALKDALTSPPVMAIPKLSEPLILACDASNMSISYNLLQMIDGRERVVEYGGRGLKRAELNYSTSEKELLAIVAGVQHYHEYLNGQKFIIRTDHKSLQYLQTMKHSTGRLGRWNLLLSRYDFTIEHTKGRENVLPDTLSRIQLPDSGRGPEEELDQMLLSIDPDIFGSGSEDSRRTHRRLTEISIVDRQQPSPVPLISAVNSTEGQAGDFQDQSEQHLMENYDISTEQAECPDCMPLIAYLRDGELPAQNDALARKIVIQSDYYVYEDNILYHLHSSRRKRLNQIDPVVKQLVIPRSLREHILKAYHDENSHVGTDKMYETIRNKFFWINLYSDVHLWTKSCLACQAGKPTKQAKAPLKSLQIEPTIFERFHIDHLSLPTSNDYKYVLVAIDSFSLYCILMPCYTTSAEETAKLLYDNVFMVYGCKSILSDRGAGFMSKLLVELCRLLGIKQIRTSARHPATNSRCEKFNANILNALRTHCQGYKEWPSLLSTIAYSFRTTVLTNIGLSPYRIVFGVEPRRPIDHSLLPAPDLPTNVQEYVKRMEPQLQIIRDVLRKNQHDANLKTQNYYNSTAKEPQINIGDRVWILEPKTKGPKLSHKVTPRYRGPLLVIDKRPDFHVYKLQDCKTMKVLRSWIHANRLKIYHDSRDKFYTRSSHRGAPATQAMQLTAGDTASQSTELSSEEAAAATTLQHRDLTGASEHSSLRLPPHTQQRLPTNTTAAAATNSTQNDDTGSEWYQIEDILKHRRVKGTLHYLVKWKEGGRDWVPIQDITQGALDAYYIKRQSRVQRRRRKRRA